MSVNRYALAALLTFLAGSAFAASNTTIGTVAGSDAGSVTMAGSTSGSVKIDVPAAAGTGTAFHLPATTGTAAQVDVADQTVSGGANVTALSQSAGNITVDCGARPVQYIPNTGAFTLTAPANDGTCILDMENGVGAGAVTLSGFSPNTMGGATLDTTNGHNFRLYISRVHAHSTIDAKALQ